MEEDANKKVGMLTGTLLGYDIELDRPTGLVDSTGVMHTWYGQSIDRDQRKPLSVLEKYSRPNAIPAICGAALLARKATLDESARNNILFDPGYFMYKEDIDLSWKAVRAGWTLIHHPGLTVYHCRGWKGRHAVSRKMRMLSARNDVKALRKVPFPASPYTLLSNTDSSGRSTFEGLKRIIPLAKIAYLKYKTLGYFMGHTVLAAVFFLLVSLGGDLEKAILFVVAALVLYIALFKRFDYLDLFCRLPYSMVRHSIFSPLLV